MSTARCAQAAGSPPCSLAPPKPPTPTTSTTDHGSASASARQQQRGSSGQLAPGPQICVWGSERGCRGQRCTPAPASVRPCALVSCHMPRVCRLCRLPLVPLGSFQISAPPTEASSLISDTSPLPRGSRLDCARAGEGYLASRCGMRRRITPRPFPLLPPPRCGTMQVLSTLCPLK